MRPNSYNNTIRCYSTITNPVNEIPLVITPWFVTGFIDAEGSFILGLQERYGFSTGWQATCYLSIKLHSKDKFLLEAIQLYFGGIGSIKKGTNNSVIYNIVSIKEIDVIIAHFDKYPLLTEKRVDYYLFKRGVNIIQSGRHRSLEGIEDIVKIRAKLNWGLTDKLIASFPKIAALESEKVRPLVESAYVFNPYWVAGFALFFLLLKSTIKHCKRKKKSGEGNFFVDIITSSTMKIGYQVILVTKITQHIKDEQLLKNLVTYFKCGTYYKRPKENAAYFFYAKTYLKIWI